MADIFVSTRQSNGAESNDFIHAMLNPNAPNNGLYTFKSLPRLNLSDIEAFLSLSYAELCKDIFTRLELGLESSVLDAALQTYNTFDNPSNPAPIECFSNDLFMLNLHSGPTRAFKDMALQPFGALLSHFASAKQTPYVILTATSGDTGPATLQSLANKPYIKVICLYPFEGTSDVQRLQMITQGASNCKVIGIKGNFDDAQKLLKSLLASESFKDFLTKKSLSLSAANSVNIGRIVFQIIYHIWAYTSLVRNNKLELGEKLSIVVPSGNFGNILGAFFAKLMGLPIERLISASNINNILSDFINTGVYDVSKRHLIASKSPAMDILKSSNVERVLYALFGAEVTSKCMQNLESSGKYSLDSSQLALLQSHFSAAYCDDKRSLESIARAYKEGFVLDPHSAIGYAVASNMQEKGAIKKAIFLATAEWSKFAPSVLSAYNTHGISTIESSDDKSAINAISSLAKCDVSAHIAELFTKKEVQNDVLDIERVESSIKQWLDSN